MARSDLSDEVVTILVSQHKLIFLNCKMQVIIVPTPWILSSEGLNSIKHVECLALCLTFSKHSKMLPTYIIYQVPTQSISSKSSSILPVGIPYPSSTFYSRHRAYQSLPWRRMICISILLLLRSRFSRVRLCATPQTAAHQVPLSLGFSRQEHWSGLPFPSPMHESEK